MFFWFTGLIIVQRIWASSSSKKIGRIISHTIQVWYIWLHLVDFFMVNVGKAWYHSLPRRTYSVTQVDVQEKFPIRLILLASIEQEPGDLQRQGVGLVGLLQSLTSKATWKSSNSQKCKERIVFLLHHFSWAELPNFGSEWISKEQTRGFLVSFGSPSSSRFKMLHHFRQQQICSSK